MDVTSSLATVYFESCHEDGFFQKFSRNILDIDAFGRLLDAIRRFGDENRENDKVNRLFFACLVDMPYMIRNAGEHFETIGVCQRPEINKMAAELLDTVSTAAGEGLDSYFREFRELNTS